MGADRTKNFSIPVHVEDLEAALDGLRINDRAGGLEDCSSVKKLLEQGRARANREMETIDDGLCQDMIENLYD